MFFFVQNESNRVILQLSDLRFRQGEKSECEAKSPTVFISTFINRSKNESYCRYCERWCQATDYWLQQVGRAILVAMLGSTPVPTSSQTHDQVEQRSPGSSRKPEASRPQRYVIRK